MLNEKELQKDKYSDISYDVQNNPQFVLAIHTFMSDKACVPRNDSG